MKLTERIAATARHFSVITRTRGLREAFVRTASLAQRNLARKRAVAIAADERRAAFALAMANGSSPERRDLPTALVRVVAHVSSDSLRTAATVNALANLRDSTVISYECADGESAAAIIAAVAERAAEPYIAYLPAGVIPLSGWIDTAIDAITGLQVDAAGANFTESQGAAYRAEALETDAAVYRRTAYPPRTFAYAPESRVVESRERHHPAPVAEKLSRIVVIDANLPMPEMDGGSARMAEIIAMLLAKHAVTFVPAERRTSEPYASTLRRAGVEVIVEDDDITRRLTEAAGVWIARPKCAAAFLARARAANPAATIVYDTVDLHHIRERRAGNEGWERTRESEERAIAAADIVVTVSEVEREIATALGARATIVVPTMQRAVAETLAFADRSGLLFVGGFDHAPNVDAVDYLIDEIMPLVWAERPELHLTIAGSNPPPRIARLRKPGVTVAGFVRDLDPLLRSHRLSLAPLRYGAGLKAKVTQALAYGLPVIGTSIAAEGFEDAACEAIVVADNAQAFADSIIATYEDDAHWSRLSATARAAAAHYTPAAVRSGVLGVFKST